MSKRTQLRWAAVALAKSEGIEAVLVVVERAMADLAIVNKGKNDE